MSRTIDRLLPGLVAAGLLFCSVTTLAVPKAAEDQDAPVSFGEAGPRPKPAAKHALPPASKAKAAKSGTAGKTAPSGKVSGKTGKTGKSTAKKK